MMFGEVPALVVHPDFDHADPTRLLPRVPWLLWMHGRTVSKEIDPGRFLRLVREGIGSVAVDLPGHGERSSPELQTAPRALEVVERMAAEVDGIVDAVEALGGFDPDQCAIGGMSAGGMAAVLRLFAPHRFCAAALESTVGDLDALRGRELDDPTRIDRLDPMRRLDQWRPIPTLVLHNKGDEWVPIQAQRRFVAALRARETPSARVEMHEFSETGAPGEHAGFGRFGAEAKRLHTEFLARSFGMH